MPDGLIKKLLKVLCPYLLDMASRTNNKVDDFIVGIICAIVKDEEDV